MITAIIAIYLFGEEDDILVFTGEYDTVAIKGFEIGCGHEACCHTHFFGNTDIGDIIGIFDMGDTRIFDTKRFMTI